MPAAIDIFGVSQVQEDAGLVRARRSTTSTPTATNRVAHHHLPIAQEEAEHAAPRNVASMRDIALHSLAQMTCLRLVPAAADGEGGTARGGLALVFGGAVLKNSSQVGEVSLALTLAPTPSPTPTVSLPRNLSGCCASLLLLSPIPCSPLPFLLPAKTAMTPFSNKSTPPLTNPLPNQDRSSKLLRGASRRP